MVRDSGGESPWGGANTWTPEQQHAVEAATEILWRATGGKYGLCQETIRPCRSGCAGAARGGLETNFFPFPCTGCGSDAECGCADPSEIRLPGPVYWEPLGRPPDWNSPFRPDDKEPDVDNEGNALNTRYRMLVWIDGHTLREPGWPVDWTPGEPLPPGWQPSRGQYFVQDGNRLIRTDGGTWPTCQNLENLIQPRRRWPHEARGTFAIQYWRGLPVPPGGRRAVAMLACELWKACTGDRSCRLPQHVQSITREGVQYQLVDPTDYTKGGRTGLPDVDMWLAQVNPHGMRAQPAVYSPDMPTHRASWSSGGTS